METVDTGGDWTWSMLSLLVADMTLRWRWLLRCRATAPACSRSHDSVRKFSIYKFCPFAEGNICNKNNDAFTTYFRFSFDQPGCAELFYVRMDGWFIEC